MLYLRQTSNSVSLVPLLRFCVTTSCEFRIYGFHTSYLPGLPYCNKTFSVKLNMIHMYTNIQQDATIVSWCYCEITLHVLGTLRAHCVHLYTLYTNVENDARNHESKMNTIVTRRNATKEAEIFICSPFSQRLSSRPSRIRGFIIITASSTALGPAKPSVPFHWGV
jgi:hypothetical protein